MKFLIRIPRAQGDTTWQALYEVAAGIEYSLKQLNHDAFLDIKREADINTARAIIFNAHRLPEYTKIPYDAIIFNSEQVQTEGALGEAWRKSSYLKHLKEHIVWDYSEINASRLNMLGVKQVVHCPIGYYPNLTKIIQGNEDIDVLFIGSLNERRKKTLYEISAKKLKTHVLYGVYGQERDNWVSRSKLVLNMHFYPNPVWEIFRASYLLANKKCVVTEDGGCDATLEAFAKNTCVYTSYDKLADTCVALIEDPVKLKKIAENGHSILLQNNQVDFVKKALASTT